MKFIYLSPHFDDAVYSCGGLIHNQVSAGNQVEIWTICGGQPQTPLSAYARDMHEGWGTSENTIQQRNSEDANACKILGASRIVFDIPDVIYRYSSWGEPIVSSDEELFTPLHEEELPLVKNLSKQFLKLLEDKDNLISPLAIGGHIDHRLVRLAAEETGLPLRYYQDYPYITWEQECQPPLDLVQGLMPVQMQLNHEDFEDWQIGIQAYSSQFTSFWKSSKELEESLIRCLDHWGGYRLYD